MFATPGLDNLQQIDLSHCGVEEVHLQAFLGLSDLNQLDLSHNLLRTVPSHSFVNIRNLKRLNLSKNEIHEIRFLEFVLLHHLETLDLSSCKITTISSHWLTGLSSLKFLSLANNQIKYLQHDASLPASLELLYLTHNPWHCDCSIMTLRQLVADTVVTTDMPRCVTPPMLTGTPVLGTSEACIPRIVHTAHQEECL